MSWNEAAAAVNPVPAGNDPWAVVQQVRHDVASGASQSPGM